MAADEHQRIVLLNRLISKSTTKAPQGNQPHVHSARELLEIVDARRKTDGAVEYLGLTDAETEDPVKRAGADRIRLKAFSRTDMAHATDYTLLIEYIDQAVRGMTVVHLDTFNGRELTGEQEERGAYTAHVVVRVPAAARRDDASYRCVVEAGTSVTRRDIESLLCRQLRKEARNNDWTFPGMRKAGSKGKAEKDYRYTPRLELLADIGRKVSPLTAGDRPLAHMLFTKRSERRSIGVETSLVHEEFVADVDIKVSASQGPSDPTEKAGWLTSIRSYYASLGYETRMFYRQVNGGIMAGQLAKGMDGAADLFMCPREVITLASAPQPWVPHIRPDVVEQMRILLDKDALWERGQ